MCLSIDINECKEGLHGCHVNAICNNSAGSYNCTCKPGFIGDERNNCKGKVVIVVAFFHYKKSPFESFTAPFASPLPNVLFQSQVRKCCENVFFFFIVKVSVKLHAEQIR